MDEATQQRLDDGKACLEAALDYAARYGWSCLCLCPPDHVGVGAEHARRCKHPGKAPFGFWKEFQERAMTERELRYKWGDLPNANVGVALGPVSKIIRIDCEGERGRSLLEEMSGGDLPPTLQFKSGRRDGSGMGWLYGIPQGAVLRTTIEAVEKNQELRFQAKGAQTVLPPSRHKDGGKHLWIPGHGPGDLEIAPMPAWLLAELAPKGKNGSHRTPGQWADLFAGVGEGSRNSSAAAVIGKILFSINDLTDTEAVETIWAMTQAWNERNDPPLDDNELKTVFSSILQKEVARRSDEDQAALEKFVEQQIVRSTENTVSVTSNGTPAAHATLENPVQDWHLVIIESKPPEYLLRSPEWSERPKVMGNGGYIRLTVKQVMTWSGIREGALAQADVRIRDKLKGWQKLLQRLLDCAEHRSVSLEQMRPLLVVAFLYNCLKDARPARIDENGEERIGSGNPVLIQDGRTIVKSDWLVKQAAFGIDAITRKEIMETMAAYGMKPEQMGTKKKRNRWWTIDDVGISRLSKDALDEK